MRPLFMNYAVDIQRNGYRRSANGKAIHHDSVFYNICAELGLPDAKRTHNITDLKPARVYRRFNYTCNVKGCTNEHVLKTPSHNKLQKGKYEYYTFKKCGGKIYKHTFIEELPK